MNLYSGKGREQYLEELRKWLLSSNSRELYCPELIQEMVEFKPKINSMNNKLGKNYYDEIFEIHGITQISIELSILFAKNKLNRELERRIEDAKDREFYMNAVSCGHINPFKKSGELLRNLQFKYESICRRNN